MKVTKSVINDTVKRAVGEDVIPLVEFIKNRKNISEFKIAEKLGTEVNQTRTGLKDTNQKMQKDFTRSYHFLSCYRLFLEKQSLQNQYGKNTINLLT